MVEPLRGWVERSAGEQVWFRCQPVAGGCIHRAWRSGAAMAAGLFVKTTARRCCRFLRRRKRGASGPWPLGRMPSLRDPGPAVLRAWKGEAGPAWQIEWLDLEVLRRWPNALDPVWECPWRGATAQQLAEARCLSAWEHDNYIRLRLMQINGLVA